MLLKRNQDSWQYLPIRMRGAFRPEPKSQGVFPSLNTEYMSDRTKIPGSTPQFKCDVPSDQNQSCRQYLPVGMRGVCRSELKFLAVFSSLNAEYLSVRTKIPSSMFRFQGDVPFFQNQNSWRYFPVQMRGVCRSEPKFLANFSNLNARRFSVRTKIPSDIYQFECQAFVGRDRNS